MREENMKVDVRILFFAFRYSLGRMTYAPYTVVSAIKNNIKSISDEDVQLYIEETRECKNYGMDFDKKHWLEFANYLEKELEHRGSNPNPTEVEKATHIDRDVLFFAFRYTLGDCDSDTNILADAVKNNIQNISIGDITAYIKEIREQASYGMKFDKVNWMSFADYLEKELENRF